MSIVVVANPKARQFVNDPSQLQALYSLTSGKGLLITPSSTAELDQELRELMEEDPELGRERPTWIGVAGGDGTLSWVVDRLLHVWEHDRLPQIAPLHGGTMNTISLSLGNHGTAAEQLAALMTSEAHKSTRRWTLQVGDRHGFLFGVGIIPRYIEKFEDGEPPTPKKAARLLARLALSAFTGSKEAAEFFQPSRFDIYVDGRHLPLKQWLVVAAGSTHDLGLRFRPFRGLLQSPNTFGLFASASQPSMFSWDLLSFRAHQRARHSLAFHALPRETVLVAPEPFPFNLDGQLYTAPTQLRLKVGPAIEFRLPPSAKPPKNTLVSS